MVMVGRGDPTVSSTASTEVIEVVPVSPPVPAPRAALPAQRPAAVSVPAQRRAVPVQRAVPRPPVPPAIPVPDLAPADRVQTPLPQPPDRYEMLLYRRRRLWAILVPSLISFSGLAISQVLFIRMSPWLWLLVPAFAFTFVYYVISLTTNLFTPPFDLERHRRIVREWKPARHPSVDVFLPVCGEPLDVLLNAWKHVREMADHYRGRVHVYVLDDSPNTARKEAALGLGFVYQRRPNRGWYKKAGNLRYAYRRTLGDAILVLDADFAPRHDMLDEMAPYLDAEPDVGIVQSPQYFRAHRRQGWLERGAGAVQELFYRSVQVSRQHHDAAICVGSCALYRRTALDAIDGSTLIEHSEDVHTGFDMRRRGWRLRYLPIPLAAGLCPGDVASFFTQQYRWCAGSMSLLGSTKFWNTPMRWRARLSYASGFCYYTHTALFTFVGPLVPILLMVFFPHFVRLEHYLLIVPSVLYNFVVFPVWHRTRYRVESWTVKLIYGWAHAWAIWDILRGQTAGWQPTGGTGPKNRTTRLWVGLALWSAGAGLVWTAVAAIRMTEVDAVTFVPAFLAGAFYLTVVLQALLVDPAREARKAAG
jgi:cellulose synthase (UDP-forming)